MLGASPFIRLDQKWCGGRRYVGCGEVRTASITRPMRFASSPHPTQCLLHSGLTPAGVVFVLMVIILAGLFPAAPANADEIRPALLDIKEQNTGLFAVTWKVPTRGDRVLAITPRLPGSLVLVGSPSIRNLPGARIEQSTYNSNGKSLTGSTIVIDGLAALQTDVLLLIQLQDGTQHSAILRPGSPEFTIPLEASKLEVAGDYWRMGTIHILEGVDHLLFVLALLLIVSGLGQGTKPLAR